MADEYDERDWQIVTLVDRTGQGGGEIIYDGLRIPIRPEFPIRARIARWLLRASQHMIHTTEGQFVCRFGVKRDPDSEDLILSLGEEVADCSPLEIDTTRLEGWDAESVDPDRDKATAVDLKIPTSVRRTRDGSRGQAGFGGRK